MDDIKKIFQELNIEINKIIRVNTLANYLAKVESPKDTYYIKIYNSNARAGYKLSNLYPLLEKKGVPVPKVIKFDDSIKVINKPYLILTEVEGDMLKDSNVTPDFFFDLGKINSITFDKFGESYDGQTVTEFSEIRKGPFNTWKEMHKEIISNRLSRLKGTDMEDLIKPIETWFEEKSYLIDYKITPRLLHIDLNAKNIFVKNNKVSGIIDMDDGFVGHNEEELMRTMTHFCHNQELLDSFFKGYTEHIQLDNGYEERKPFYYLSRLLVHIGCILDFGKDYVGDEDKEKSIIREEINKILGGKPLKFDKNKINT